MKFLSLKYISIIVLFQLLAYPLMAQKSKEADEVLYKKVFLINDNGDKFDKLSQVYGSTLFSACHFEGELYTNTWSNVVKTIQESCVNGGLDINNYEIWIKVFFDTSGSINFIGYNPTSSSKPIDSKKFEEILNKMIENYNCGVKSTDKFAQSSRILFPINFEN